MNIGCEKKYRYEFGLFNKEMLRMQMTNVVFSIKSTLLPNVHRICFFGMESLHIMLVRLQNQSLRYVLNDLQSAVLLLFSDVFFQVMRQRTQTVYNNARM